MILTTNNFLPSDAFYNLQEYCESNIFEVVKVGNKEFSILQTPNWMLPFLQIKGHNLILTFIRRAYNGFDEEPRIHADNIINGEKTALASVLYINNDSNVTENGTCFYEHVKYGNELPIDISDDDFDYLLNNDSNNLNKWSKTTSVQSKPNRRVLYNSNLFHSKYPANIEKGVRIVLVCFYTKKES